MDLTEDEYYRRRGNRMRRLAPNLQYQEVPVALTASERQAESTDGQATILAAANLLARWARNLEVDVPNPMLSVPGPDDWTLRDRIRSEVNRADPFCDLNYSSPKEDALILQVGSRSNPDCSPDFAVSGDGWDAVGWKPDEHDITLPERTGCFPPAGQLAACLGTAQLFKLATGQPEESRFNSFRWRMWDHGMVPLDEVGQPSASPPSSPEVGRILQAGVGAVGSNVVYFLAQGGVRADITLIDYDTVEFENLDRTLLFGAEDAAYHGNNGDRGRPKAEAAKRTLSDVDQLEIEPFIGSWNDFVERGLSGKQFDAWLALANEERAWQSMAHNFPPLVVHGTTTGDWRVTLGRHIPFVEYCLHCRFGNGNDETPSMICGKSKTTVRSQDESEEVHASLPFLSGAAAALVAGELLKAQKSSYRSQPNYVEADLKGPLGSILSMQRSAKSDCRACANIPQDAWRDRIEDSRYFFLSAQNTAH